jgi:hypothetical protein
VLTWLGVVALSAAALVAARWAGRRVDPLGRPRGFPVWSVVLLALLGAALVAPGLRREHAERRLEAAAGELAGRDVEVECQTLGGAFVDAGAELGYVPFGADGEPEPQTLLKYEPCRDLMAYLRSDKRSPSPQQVVAVHVLSHEAMHMSGLRDEARTECAAVQRDARTARLLGATPAAAAALARAYWRGTYPRMPEGYRSAECRPGGAMDEGLADGPW